MAEPGFQSWSIRRPRKYCNRLATEADLTGGRLNDGQQVFLNSVTSWSLHVIETCQDVRPCQFIIRGKSVDICTAVQLANWFARDVIHKLRLSGAGFKHFPRVPRKKRTDGSTKFVNGFLEGDFVE